MILLALTTIVVVLASWIYLNRHKVNRAIEEAISTQINGEFTFDGVSFRPFYKGLGITFVFRDVAIIDPVLAQPVLYSEKVGIRVSLTALYNQERLAITTVMLENGYFKMVRDQQGYLNSESFKSRKDQTRGEKKKQIVYEGTKTRVLLDNMNVSYYDSTRHKSYAFLAKEAELGVTYSSDLLSCRLKGDILYKGLLFNKEKGAFLSDKNTYTDLHFTIQLQDYLIKIHTSSMLLAEKYPVYIHGEVQLANAAKQRNGYYAFDFSVSDIPAAVALNHLTPTLERKISALKILPIVDAYVRLKGEFQQNYPLVEVDFETDTFDYTIKDIVLTDLKAKGYYTSQVDVTQVPSDSNSVISCTDIQGFFETLPVKATVAVSNLRHPVASVAYALHANMYDLNKMLDPTKYVIKEGQIQLEGVYNGGIDYLYKPEKDQFNGHLAGRIGIKNLAGEFMVNRLSLKEVNAAMQFDENTVHVEGISFKKGTDQSPMEINGEIHHVISSLVGGAKPIRAQMSVYTKHWDLGWIDLLTPPTTLKATGQAEMDPTTEQAEYKSTQWIERVIGKFELDAHLHAEKVTYQRFEAEQVKGNLKMTQDKIELSSLTLNAFEGNVSLNVGLKGLATDTFPTFFIRGEVMNASVKEVFYGLGNFGQHTLTDQNLEGILQAKITLEGELLSGGNIAFPSLKGELDFTLFQGRIINFSPFLKIKKFIFKNRKLEDVQFDPISALVKIRGEDLLVDNLSVSSNVLSFVVEGIYSFVDRTNFLIRIPLSDLKRAKTKNMTEKKQNHKAIYLKAFEENGSLQIMIDGKRSLR